MRGLGVAARIVGISLAIVFGAGLILIAFTLGDCSAFGGRCPQDPPPLLDDDTFGMAAIGAALVVGVPVFLSAPSWRRLAIAAGSALAAALVIGLLARSAATS